MANLAVTSGGVILYACWSGVQVHELASMRQPTRYELVRSHTLPRKMRCIAVAKRADTDSVIISHLGVSLRVFCQSFAPFIQGHEHVGLPPKSKNLVEK